MGSTPPSKIQGGLRPPTLVPLSIYLSLYVYININICFPCDPKLAYMLTCFGLVKFGSDWWNDPNHQSECLVMVFNECHTLTLLYRFSASDKLLDAYDIGRSFWIKQAPRPLRLASHCTSVGAVWLKYCRLEGDVIASFIWCNEASCADSQLKWALSF